MPPVSIRQPARMAFLARIFCCTQLKTGLAAMKIRNSLRSLAKRDRDNRVVRRRGRLYVINKIKKRYKARQG